MDDINLLPEELRKKENKTLENKGSFKVDNIEFTPGQELSRDDKNAKLVSEKGSFSWFKPSLNKKFDNVNHNQDKKRIEIPTNNNFKPREMTSGEQYKNISPNNKESLNNGFVQKSEKQKIAIQEKPQAKTTNEKINTKKSNSVSLIQKIKNVFNKKSTTQEKKPDVNLLPDSTALLPEKNILFLLISTFLISIMFVFVIFFALNIYKLNVTKQSDTLDKQLNDNIASLNSYSTVIKDVENLQNKSKEIKKLFDKHIYWTKFFEAIENNTLAEVRYTNFSGGLNGNLTLSALAPDYQTVVRQWMYLKRAKNFAKNVIITGANLSQTDNKLGGNISFSITLDLADDIFYKTTK
jgi:hypothetical protein